MATSKIKSSRTILWEGSSNITGTTLQAYLNDKYAQFKELAFVFSDISPGTTVTAECVIPTSAMEESTNVGLRTTAFGATHYYVQVWRLSDSALNVTAGQLTALSSYNLYLKRIEGYN